MGNTMIMVRLQFFTEIKMAFSLSSQPISTFVFPVSKLGSAFSLLLNDWESYKK